MYCLQNEAAVLDCFPIYVVVRLNGENCENELLLKLSTNKFTEFSSHPTQGDTATSFPSALVNFR